MSRSVLLDDPGQDSLSRQVVPEGPDGGEALHGLREVGEQRELGAVLQLLEVPVGGTEAEITIQMKVRPR